MKILFVSDYLEEISGSGNLSRAHLNTIRSIIHENDLFIVALSASKTEANNQIKCYSVGKSRIERLVNFLQLNPIKINNSITKDISNWINDESIDLVFIDNSIYGKLVKYIRLKNKNVKVYSFYIDVKRNLYTQWLKHNGLKFFPRFIVGIYGEYLNQKYSNCNITLNDRESSMFLNFYKRYPSFELPIIIEKPKLEINSSVFVNYQEKIKLLFVGAKYYPNINGIIWFVNNVMSKLSPQFHLFIVGRDMEKSSAILGLSSDNISIIGSVDDLAPYYNGCDIIVAPIFEGAGMKVKTAEALSYGKLFIGTSESLEGYTQHINSSSDNKSVICCNTADQFIQYLKNLNKEQIEKFIIKNHQIYLDFYSEEAAAKVLAEKFFSC